MLGVPGDEVREVTIMKCPQCVAEGRRSTVRVLSAQTVCAINDFSTFYDEDGRYHHHSKRPRVTTCRCSNGHEWDDEYLMPCPQLNCDFGKVPASMPQMRHA